jgi:hypothetical protein
VTAASGPLPPLSASHRAKISSSLRARAAAKRLTALRDAAPTPGERLQDLVDASGEFLPGEVLERVVVVTAKRRSKRLERVAALQVDLVVPPAVAARVAERKAMVARLRALPRAERMALANACRRALGRQEFPPTDQARATARRELALDDDLMPPAR